MSAIRKLVLSAAGLFLGLSALFGVTGTAMAAAQPIAMECEDDWHTPCP